MPWRWGWKPLLVATVLGAVGIQVVGPNHNALQVAADADAFRRVLGDDAGRYVVSAVIDLGFAAAYGLLGLALLRAIDARGWLARVSAVGIVVGAACDEIENGLLIANLVRHEDVTDGWVGAMKAVGAVKWTAGAIGFLALSVLLVGAAIQRRRGPQQPS